MIGKIMDWFSVLGTFTLAKVLPMVILAALGVLAIQAALKITKKMLEKSKLEKAAHTLILTAVQVVLYILLALMVASGLGIDVTGIVALASVLTLAVSWSLELGFRASHGILGRGETKLSLCRSSREPGI